MNRHQQSRLLNQWGEEQEIPIIAVGDYNYDWEVEDGENNLDEGIDLLTAADIFTWVRPLTLKEKIKGAIGLLLLLFFILLGLLGHLGVI